LPPSTFPSNAAVMAAISAFPGLTDTHLPSFISKKSYTMTVFPLLRAGLIAISFLSVQGSLARAAETLRMPAQAVSAQCSVGEGTGAMEISNGQVRLQGTGTAFAKYSENWIREATVLDYLLPTSVPLPGKADRLSFVYNYPSARAQGTEVDLRVLISDRRGGLWAMGTKFGARLSRLSFTQGVSVLETYPFDTTEMGRQDCWVAMSLNPQKFDEYDVPQAPFNLAGFRVILGGSPNIPFTLTLSRFQALSTTERPDPYWLLTGENIWSQRVNHGKRESGAYGWGSVNAQPLLRAADLSLSPGPVAYTWEILAADEWRVISSDRGEQIVSNSEDVFLKFPLLPVGTYHLRIALKPTGEKKFQEVFFTYVVIRNHGVAVVDALPRGKPLQFGGSGPVLQNQEVISLSCHLDASQKVTGKIRWTVEASDGRLLKSGESEASRVVSLPVGAWSEGESTLWIKAEWILNGAICDVARRVVGFLSPSSGKMSSAEKEEKPNEKLRELNSQFYRTKGDWNEGGTLVATGFDPSMKVLLPWLDEARTTGYNTVELSAPWFDLNPLPGVYQFQYLDKIVAQAHQRGLGVVLRVNPAVDLTPLWVDRAFQQDQDGLAHGLWAGSNSLIFSASSLSFRNALDRYLEALAAHYRANPFVLGYTLSSLYFDHDLLDAPWAGQTVDYSETSHRAFIVFLRGREDNDLSKFNRLEKSSYAGWDEIPMPRPETRLTASGRLQPRIDPLWLAWIKYKVDSVRDFRLSNAEALRRGDPGCWVGLYASDTTKLYLKEIAEAQCWMTYGSMEAQFPMGHLEVHGRFEPIAKIARTTALVDVGLTNILMSDPPGYHGFFNYWMLSWRLASLKPAESEAEHRLKQWFGIIDRLMGAQFSPPPTIVNGGYLTSFSTQLLVLQNTFMGRFEDFLKPYTYRLGTDKVRTDEVLAQGNEVSLAGRPYLYVPFGTMVISPAVRDEVLHYVGQGGRLILEANSGYWLETNDQHNALAGALGLPSVEPTRRFTDEKSEPALWKKNSPLSSSPLAFRIKPFEPPINDQLSPWIQDIPQAILQPYRVNVKAPAAASIIAAYADGSPAAYLLPYGKGEVLMFCGVIDWLGCPGLSRAIDAWGHGGVVDSSPPGDPLLLQQGLIKGQAVYVVGRRFINQDLIASLKQGENRAGMTQTQTMSITFPQTTSLISYRVKELLSGADFGVVDGEQLKSKGVTLSLTPGQAFLLEALPSK
jgi:hypothetical protein